MVTKKLGEQIETTLDITLLDDDVMTLNLLGESPMIYNAMSAKTRMELLMPKGKKSTAEKQTSLKHDVLNEFRDSLYRHIDDTHPTRLMFPANAFKKAAMTAALDLPGVKKSQIGRLVWIEGQHVDIYGVPQLIMSVVRSSDINRTPDIRTRAILASWACTITLRFTKPHLKPTQVANLIANAGKIIGIGDWRQEKGSGNFGQFRVVDADDKDFIRLIAKAGLEAQDRAIADPSTYDSETQNLYKNYEEEAGKREKVITRVVRK